MGDCLPPIVPDRLALSRTNTVFLDAGYNGSTMTTFPEGLIHTLREVSRVAESARIACYLVGGLIRDQLLDRPLRYLNVDVAVPRDGVRLAHRIADQLHGAFVPLDDSLGCARVVIAAATRIEVDISTFRGDSIDADLRLRDFTVNAIAVSLADWLRTPNRPGPLIDPLHGEVALRQRRLVPCFAGTFMDDPVRILRAARFAAQLEFSLDPDARPLMTAAVPALARVAGERVRDELLAIFETDQAHPAIQLLNEVGVLDVLIPELTVGRGVEQGGYHHLDVLGHQIETIAQGDRFLKDFAEFSEPLRQPMAAYCAQQVVERRSRKSLIKLSCLLHDIGKPSRRTVESDGEIWFLGHEETGAEYVPAITERLRLSNRESELVRLMVLHHLRPGFLSREPQLTRRAVYRFFKDLGDDGPSCLLTWWADRMATRGPQSRLDQLDQQRARLEELLNAYFFQSADVVKPPRLINGNELMRALKIPSGPLVGELLQLIEEAQAEGRIHTAEEALALAGDRIRTGDAQ